MIEIFQFVALVLTALSMSVHFGTWLTEAPMRVTQSGALFTEVQQGGDRVAARIMPIIGNAAILSVLVCVVVVRAVPGAFALSLVALALIVADMAVTVRGNVPINKQVQSWNVAAPRRSGRSFAIAGRSFTRFERRSSCPGSPYSLPASSFSRFIELHVIAQRHHDGALFAGLVREL